jgi:hypothetical protein
MGHGTELQKLSEDLGLDRSVLFLGPRFDTAKQACYENADVFFYPL